MHVQRTCSKTRAMLRKPCVSKFFANKITLRAHKQCVSPSYIMDQRRAFHNHKHNTTLFLIPRAIRSMACTTTMLSLVLVMLVFCTCVSSGLTRELPIQLITEKETYGLRTGGRPMRSFLLVLSGFRVQPFLNMS